MSSHIFEAFEARAQQVKELMSGSGKGFSTQLSDQNKMDSSDQNQMSMQQRQPQRASLQPMRGGFQQDPYSALMGGGGPPPQIATNNNNMNQYGDPLGGGMNGYGGGAQNVGMNVGSMDRGGQLSPLGNEDDMGMPNMRVEMPMRGGGGRRASRNPSIISFGGVRGMSVTSEATFGRAMSGLSALSIDWENLEDFDVNVDHSAHIDNSGAGAGPKKAGGSADDDCKENLVRSLIDFLCFSPSATNSLTFCLCYLLCSVICNCFRIYVAGSQEFHLCGEDCMMTNLLAFICAYDPALYSIILFRFKYKPEPL